MNYSRLVVATLFWCLLCSAAYHHTAARQQVAEAAKQDAEKYRLIYQQLLERAKKGDQTVDFVQLISASMDWNKADQHQTKAPRRDEMSAAFKAKDYKKAVELAQVVLDYEFTNRSLHRALANAYRELGEKSKAEFHDGVGEKILQALLSTGDGKTIGTAYCVQGINEEYLIMASLGYEVLSQAFITSSNSAYDLLEGRDKKTGKKVGLYFDISGHFSRCVQSRQQKKK